MDLLQLWFSRRDHLTKDDYQLLTNKPYQIQSILAAFNRDVTLPEETNTQLRQHLKKMNALGSSAHYAKRKDKDGHFNGVKIYHTDDFDKKPSTKDKDKSTMKEKKVETPAHELTFGCFTLKKPYRYPTPPRTYQETRNLWDNLEEDLKLSDFEYSELIDRSESYLHTAKQNKQQLWQLLNLFSQEDVQRHILKIHDLRHQINQLLFQNPLSASRLEHILKLDQPISDVVLSIDLDTLQETRDKLYLQHQDLSKEQLTRLLDALNKPVLVGQKEATELPHKYEQLILKQKPNNLIGDARFLLKTDDGFYQAPHQTSPDYEDAQYTQDPSLAKKMKYSTMERFWHGFTQELNQPLFLYIVV